MGAAASTSSLTPATLAELQKLPQAAQDELVMLATNLSAKATSAAPATEAAATEAAAETADLIGSWPYSYSKTETVPIGCQGGEYMYGSEEVKYELDFVLHSDRRWELKKGDKVMVERKWTLTAGTLKISGEDFNKKLVVYEVQRGQETSDGHEVHLTAKDAAVMLSNASFRLVKLDLPTSLSRTWKAKGKC